MPSLTELPVATKKLSDPTSQVPAANGLSITKTTSGVQTLLPAVDHDRMILFFVSEVTEDYANNTGTKPSWDLGITGEADRFSNTDRSYLNVQSSSALARDALGIDNLASQSFDSSISCILPANKAIIVTCTPAIGDGTGACKIVVNTVNAP